MTTEFSQLVEAVEQLHNPLARNTRSNQIIPRCSKCGENKKRDQFGYKTDGRLNSWCRSCCTKKSLEHYALYGRNRKPRIPTGIPLGRPSQELNFPVQVRLDENMKVAILAMAKKRKMTTGALVRTYIEWGLENDDE